MRLIIFVDWVFHVRMFIMNLKMNLWVGVRQSVLVAVFVAYLVLDWGNIVELCTPVDSSQISPSRRFGSHQVDSFKSIFVWRREYELIEIGLFGCNLLQGGIFEAIAAWLVFIVLFLNHLFNFLEVHPQKRALTSMLFYILLTAQAIGTVVHYLAWCVCMIWWSR